MKPIQDESFFDLKANDISGKRIDFYIYKNRRAFLLVNIATKSIRAKEYYKMLSELYDQYMEHGLEILAFPCSQFSNSEPKNNDEVKAILQQKFDLKFSLFEKIDVNGINTHPVYKYLRNQPLLMNEETGKSKTIPENFTICLLNKDGGLVKYYKPTNDYEDLRTSIKRMLTQERLSMKAMATSKSIKSRKTIAWMENEG